MTLPSFQRSLTEAAIKVASNVAMTYQSEGIYCFALYTSGEYGYVIDSFSTVAGLKVVAEEHVRGPWRSYYPDEDVATRKLKWSPCDSPHFSRFKNEFRQAQEQIDAIWGAVDRDADDSTRETCRQIHDAFIAALLAVRESRVFDSSVVLNILMGDQSNEERLLNAEPLNSPEVLKRLRTDLPHDPEVLEEIRKNRWK